MRGPKVDENKKPIEEHWQEIGDEHIKLTSKFDKIEVDFLDLTNTAWDQIKIAWDIIKEHKYCDPMVVKSINIVKQDHTGDPNSPWH